MADDLEKFVLSYEVRLSDSIGKLEKLHEKMNKTGDASKKSGSALKSFAADATGELGKLVPGVDAVSKAVRGMGAEFGAAGAAIGALAIGIKAVMDMRNQYNAQRGAGMQLGVSSLRVENWQRQLVNRGGGYVTRDSAAEGLKQFSDMANAAYADPSRLGREARIMRMLGVNVGERGQTPTGMNDELTQFATTLNGKSAGDVQGIAKATGFSQDFLLSLQKVGPEIGHITELTNDEIKNRQQAEDSLAKFNDQLGHMKENFTELSNELAEPLLPALENLVAIMKQLADLIPKTGNQSTKLDNSVKDYAVGKKSYGSLLGDFFKDKTGIDIGSKLGNSWIGKFYNGGGLMGALGIDPDHVGAPGGKGTEQAKQAAKKAADKRDEAVDKLDEQNKTGIQAANQMNLAVNMFAGAVQSFSSAINIQQAWAAWAGEAGKAAGIPGSSGTSARGLSGGGSGNWRGSEYSTQIKAAADKTGLDPQLIYSVMQTESHGKNGQYSSTGAGGLMQVTRGNWKKLGNGADVMDPATNIMVGAGILKEQIGIHKGDLEAGLRGYNGNSDPNYVDKVAANYGGAATGFGESKAKMNIRSVQQQIADYLHVPLDQVQRGGVKQGDAQWAVQQLENGMSNNLYGLKQKLAVGGLPDQDYAKLKLELRDQTRGLDLMRQYAADVASKQQAGGRELTAGERPIIQNFTINGATDPKAVADEVNRQITKGMSEVLNHYNNGIKG